MVLLLLLLAGDVILAVTLRVPLRVPGGSELTEAVNVLVPEAKASLVLI